MTKIGSLGLTVPNLLYLENHLRSDALRRIRPAIAHLIAVVMVKNEFQQSFTSSHFRKSSPVIARYDKANRSIAKN